MSLVLSLIFCDFGKRGHFRTARGAQATQALSTTAGRAIARSGVYMGVSLTDSVIRFGFLVEWGDAREEGCFLLIVRGLTRANAIRSSREHD